MISEFNARLAAGLQREDSLQVRIREQAAEIERLEQFIDEAVSDRVAYRNQVERQAALLKQCKEAIALSVSRDAATRHNVAQQTLAAIEAYERGEA